MKTPLVFVCIFLSLCQAELSRDDLVEFLRFKQETRNTFDSRVHQRVKPIGTIAGKPIWPKIVDRVNGPGDIWFDDDNFGYVNNARTAADMIREMDRKKEYDFVVGYLGELIEKNDEDGGPRHYGR